MGNVISNNTYLENHITNWALNKYDEGYSWNKPQGREYYESNLLKKRACCVGPKDGKFPISLLYIDPLYQAGVPFTVNEQYMLINLFKGSEFEKATEDYSKDDYIKYCSTGDLNNYRFNENSINSSYHYKGSAQCNTLYSTLCKEVKEARAEIYKDNYKTAYGPYTIKENNNGYVDCNCMNSALREHGANIIDTKTGTKIDLTDQTKLDTFVYNSDIKCQINNDITYKTLDQSPATYCVNIANINDNNIDGVVNVKQTCGTEILKDLNLIDPDTPDIPDMPVYVPSKTGMPDDNEPDKQIEMLHNEMKKIYITPFNMVSMGLLFLFMILMIIMLPIIYKNSK